MHIPSFRFFTLLLLLAYACPSWGQKQAQDTLNSRVLLFRETGTNNTAKAIVQITLNDPAENEAIMGATVLLRRDKDKMLGKVSNAQGKCIFHALPATYTMRVQMTGLKTLEKSGLSLAAGKTYQIEVAMRKQ